MSIDYDLLKNIENYATRHLESSRELYKIRNYNEDKFFHNILNGKIGEWCNYLSLIDGGYIVEAPPCMQIFSAGNKSHDADLVIIGKDNKLFDNKKYIHIKSILKENYENFGASFLVEKTNPHVKHPQNNHYYSVMLQESLLVYNFHRWIPLVDAQYKPPVVNLPTKLAVYLD